jgi:hypothetical protein
MKRRLLGFLAVALIIAVTNLGMVAYAQQKAPAPAKPTSPMKPAMHMGMGAPGIEGTYRWVSRKLPDGKMLMPPQIEGLQTFTKNYRNFNVAWQNPDGKHFSYSVVSQYKLTPTEYSETRLYSLMNDEIGVMPGTKGDAGPQYAMTSETRTAPVKESEGKIEMKLPFDPPSVVVGGGKFIATMPDGSVDTWEKVN